MREDKTKSGNCFVTHLKNVLLPLLKSFMTKWKLWGKSCSNQAAWF